MDARLPRTLLVLALAGCTRQQPAAAPATPAGEKPKGELTPIAVKRDDLFDTVTWTGTALAAERLEIRSEKQLKIKQVVAQNLTQVAAGDLLVEVDLADLEKKLQESKDRMAQISLEMRAVEITFGQREKTLERRRKLAAKGIIAQKDLEEAEKDFKLEQTNRESKNLDFQKVKSDLANAQAALKSSNFVAPVAGLVSNLPDPSARDLAAAAVVAVISNPETLALWISVEETYRMRLAVGMPAEIELDAAPGVKLEGTVKEVSVSPETTAGSTARTYRTRIGFTKKPAKIQEGFKGRVTVSFAQALKALSVPINALKYVDGQEYLLVGDTRDAKPALKPVGVGLKTETEAEIKTGVADGQYVFTEN